MIQWIALEMSALKCSSLAASPFTSSNSLKAGPCADTLPGITNPHFPDLQCCSQLVLLPLCSPSLACIFTCPPAAPVSLVLHRAWAGSLSCIKAHQEVMLMSRAEQEVYFPFHSKILEFNLNVFFVLKCPCETIKNCLCILSRFWNLKAIGI